MTLARPTPPWRAWPMRRGQLQPQVWPWQDDEGLVAITDGIEVRLRIVWPDGTVRESIAGAESDLRLLEQDNPLTRGHIIFYPSDELVESLPIHPSARYRLEARREGWATTIIEGEIAMHPGDAETSR